MFSAVQLTSEIAQKVADDLDKPRWKPGDPVLLAMLARRRQETGRSVVRIGLWAAVVSYIIYGLCDWFLFPDVGTNVVLARILVGLTFLALLEICVRARCSLDTLHLVAATAVVSGALIWLGVALTTEYQQSLAAFMVFGTVFVLGANLFFDFKLWLAALSSTIVAIGFILAALFLIEARIEIRAVVALYFANFLALSMYLSWRFQVERYRAFLHYLRAQSQEQAAVEKGHLLNEMANTDPLTGLRNRRAIAYEFSRLIHEYATDGYEIGLILIDVDYFKRFNDRLGHQCGDDCLVSLAKALEETAKTHNAIAGRFGGEEFIVLCRVNDADQLAEIARSYCHAVEQLRIVHPDRGDDQLFVTISVGASLTRTDTNLDFRRLVQEADRALYVAKFSGRATSAVYNPATIKEDRASENIAELLATAVGERRLFLVYQPIFESSSRKLIGNEALMRMRDRDGATIGPAVFIPVAEETGMVSRLGAWAIGQACEDMLQHDLGAIVSVNISAAQLKDPDFARMVSDTLASHNISARRLALEVTESMELVIGAVVIRNLEHLRALGVQVWLDDFGTGFAGLAWLRRFDFDVVKIDRSFLHDCDSAVGLRMLQDMVQLLHNQGRLVLIEGVETAEQEALAKDLAVHSMQGFFLGRPTALGGGAQGHAPSAG